MSLAPGTRLGVYEIAGPIGTGGMGEVYRARDTKLNRDVALKVLPAVFAADPERLARFKREAQLLASLNHPHIGAIYGLEETETVRALVLELVEGPTLAEVIERAQGSRLTAQGPDTSQSDSATSPKPEVRSPKPHRAPGQSVAESGQSPEATAPSRWRGATERGGTAFSTLRRASPQLATIAGERRRGAPRGLRIDEALSIARQIADALEAAHEKGIIHRDLKPANIKVPSDDRVKVLDFGLAKAFDPLTPAGEEEWGEGAALSNSPTMSVLATGAGAILGTAAYMSPEQARGKAVDKRTDIWAFGCVLYEMLAGRPAFGGETASDTISLILQREPDWSALPAATPAMVRRLVGRCLEKDPKRRLRDIGDVRLEIDEALAEPAATISPPVIPAPRGSPRVIVWLLVGALSASTIVAVSRVWPRAQTSVRRDVASQRLTDFVGIEESPAISPDGKTVAFVAPAAGKRQIWIRLLAGGAPLQITNDGGDHQQPRWTPDSSTLIYYALPVTLGGDGTLWEISALGGSPRRLGSAVSGGDVSHDGRRVAVFQIQKGSIQLSAISRDGSLSERLHELSPDWGYSNPRWSPDDRVVAFQRSNTFDFDVRLSVAAANDVPVQDVAQGDDLRGASWLPDGSGFVYSSSRGSTVLYPPAFNLRMVGRDGTGDRQLTFGDVSYADPDLHSSGKLAASRIRSQSDIWKFPVTGSPADNTRGGTRVTHQTGAVQTPSLSPDGTELVYLSDSGGHGNLWIAKTDGSGVRQITFERDPAQTIGVPVWSPAGNPIVFITTRNGVTGLSAINADGSGLRQVVPRGSWAAWSGDGRWLYYMAGREGPMTLEKIPVDGGRPVVVRSDNAGGPALTPDGSTLYFVSPLKPEISSWGDWEIRKASPENGAYQAVARVSSERVPISPLLMHMFLSPDSRWLAMPLTDGTTSNIWALPTDGGPMRPLTDFGSRPVVIARRVAWSPDGKFIYAAVAETDADVALLDGLLR